MKPIEIFFLVDLGLLAIIVLSTIYRGLTLPSGNEGNYVDPEQVKN